MLRRLPLPLIPLIALIPLIPLPSQEPPRPSWDVSALHGAADTVRFDTDEGTWMNLDVSPDGQWIAFDLLGDIYRVPMAGGTAERLAGGRAFDHQPRWSPDGRTIVFVSDRSGKDNLWLMDADGRNPRALTTLDDSFPTAPAWMPDGQYVVAKRHVRSTRSLGGGEIWLFHVRGGAGVKLRDKTSFTSDQNEPYASRDGRWVYFSWTGPFDYNKDPHDGIFQVSRLDRQTGEVEPVTTSPGGAVRPTVSPDGRSLAYVKRAGTATVLVVRDLESGAERQMVDSLDHDQMETWTVHGAYPAFQWTPDAAAIVIAFGGKLRRVTVATGAADTIPFTAGIEQVVERAVRFPTPVDDAVRARAVRWPVLSPDGRTLVFSALGSLWEMPWPDGRPSRITDAASFEYAPAFSPDGRWLAYVTWDDSAGGHLWKIPATGGRRRPVRLSQSPNQYANPAFSPDGSRIAFLRGSGASNRGDGLSSEPFLRVSLVGAEGGEMRDVVRTANRGPGRAMPRVWWTADGRSLYLQESRADKTVLSLVDEDGVGRRDLLTNERAEEVVPSPDGRWVAFKELHDVYVAPLPEVGAPVTLEAKNAGVKVARLSRFGGDWIAWRPDSRAVTWALGPAFYLQDVEQAYASADTTAPDSSVGWIRANARTPARVTEIVMSAPRYQPQGAVVLRGARVVTMKGDDVVDRADVLIEGNRIARICPGTCAQVPLTARVVPVPGKTIIPGLVDVHAHMGYATLDILPQGLWEYRANLAYGVTTTHDPSASTQAVFALAELADAGRIVGPRVFSTGFVLYGAENPNKAVISSLEDARAHLRRLKALGAFSVKSYNQLRRDSRQWVIQAAREERMLVVPEGGSMLQQNITMILDGHTGIEHAIPVAPLRKDVVTLLARSGTGYTPTLIVGYGGLWGENYWYQESDVFANERLRRFMPPAQLDARARRRVLAPADEFYHIALARTAADVVRAGGSVQLGAHGQLQGLGAHWELWMLEQGGLTPLEALRAATLAGARYLGLDRDLGSIEPGKLADLVILDENPLDNIRNSEKVSMVMKNGLLYDADLSQVWPDQSAGPPVRRSAGGRR